MNYYEHHLGDYMRDTAHLSWLEDCAYRRLLDAYYIHERALPVELGDCFKLARASNKAERDAVTYVLRSFFKLQPDGYHQTRADEVIVKYLSSVPDREARKENARERQKRARERRKGLFDSLREHGIVPSFDAPTKELETLMKRVMSRTVTPPVTRDDTVAQYPTPSNTYAALGMNTPSHDEVGGSQ